MGSSAPPLAAMLQELANPSLLKLRRDAAAISKEFQELAEGLIEDQLHWSPRYQAWSVAQCLEHLTVTGQEYHLPFQVALRQARLNARSHVPLRPSPLGKWLIESAGPRAGRRLAAPKKLAPTSTPAEGALDRFLIGQRLLMAFIEEADGLAINRIRVAAPISRVLRISLGEALALTTAHARRHLEQARRVRQHPRFPA